MVYVILRNIVQYSQINYAFIVQPLPFHKPIR